jgi:hypothetical protein
MARIRHRHNRVDPALAVECAVRQEIMGHKGVFFGNHVMSSTDLRRMAGLPMIPLYPFTLNTKPNSDNQD